LWLPTMHSMEDVVIVAAARTPFGKLGGGLSSLTAPELGGTVMVAPFDIPVGRIAVIGDPQGAVFSIIKSVPPPA